MKSQKQLEKELAEKEKALQYLQLKYEEDTGKRLEIPVTWSAFLNEGQSQTQQQSSLKAPEVVEGNNAKYALEDEKGESDTFTARVHELKLPQNSYQKKGKTGPASSSASAAAASAKAAKTMMRQLKESAKKQPELRCYLLETIEIVGYEKKGFSKSGLQELLKGVNNLMSIRKVMLRENGIADDCAGELAELVQNPRIRYLDLSLNKIGKTAATSVSQALTATNHLVWLDMSANDFSTDYAASRGMIAALKGHGSLLHLGFTLSERSSEVLFSTLFSRGTAEKSINSLNLRNSKFSARAFGSLVQLLSPPRPKAIELYHITALCFKHCFLEADMIEKLSKGLQLNRTLVRLDLAYNGLKCDQGSAIIQALKTNITLAFLDMSANYLKDKFAFELAGMLRTNRVLYEVNVANNQITEKGGCALRDVLVQYNETLASLGDLQQSLNMGIRLKEEIRQCLIINALPKELKKERLEQNSSEITRVGSDKTKTAGKNVDKEALGKMKELEYVVLGKSICRDDDDRDVWRIYQSD